MQDIIDRELDNHEYDNCTFHKDEYLCDCRPCYECNRMTPEEYRSTFMLNNLSDKEVQVCDNCID